MKFLFFFFFTSVFLFANNKIHITATISPHINAQLKVNNYNQNTLYLQGNSDNMIISMPENTSLSPIHTIGTHPISFTQNLSTIQINNTQLIHQKKSLIFTISVK